MTKAIKTIKQLPQRGEFLTGTTEEAHTFWLSRLPDVHLSFSTNSVYKWKFRVGPFTRAILTTCIHLSTNLLRERTFLSTLTFKWNLQKLIKRKVSVFSHFSTSFAIATKERKTAFPSQPKEGGRAIFTIDSVDYLVHPTGDNSCSTS